MEKEKSNSSEAPQEEADLRQLIMQNIATTEALQKGMNKILRSMRLKLYFNIAWILLVIVIPSIVAAIYLPQFIGQYMNYLQTIGGLTKGL